MNLYTLMIFLCLPGPHVTCPLDFRQLPARVEHLDQGTCQVLLDEYNEALGIAICLKEEDIRST